MLGIDNIYIPHNLLMTIAKIEYFNGVWDGLEQHTTALNLLADVAAYGKKFAAVLEPLKDQPITTSLLHKLHKHLVHESGTFRTDTITLDIQSENGTHAHKLHVAEVSDLERLTTKLLEWTERTLENKNIHPLLAISVFASVFLQISPYASGNQTMMRFLVTLYMLKAGYKYAPYIALEPIISKSTDQYAAALKHNQRSIESGETDWSVWMEYFIGVLNTQAEILQERLTDDHKDIAHLPTLSRKVMTLFKDHERLQMNDIIRLTKGQRSTLKLRLGELVEDGYLKRYGQARSTWYALT